LPADTVRLTSLKSCVVELEKLRDYLLDPSHVDGRHKARYFSAFGYSQSNAVAFADALANHARDNDVVRRSASRWGHKYAIECHVETPDRRNPCIVTIWIDIGNGQARLVTSYPK